MASPTNNPRSVNIGNEDRPSTSIAEPPSSLSSSSETTGMKSGHGNEYFPLNIAEDSQDRPNGTRRINRRALVTFLGVLVVVVAIVSLTIIFVVYSDGDKEGSTKTKQARDSTSHYTFDDILNGKFYADTPDSKWISDDMQLGFDDGDIIIKEISSGKIDLLFTEERLKRRFPGNIPHNYILSPDKSWMLFKLESVKKYRFSTVGKYIAVNIQSDESIKIGTSDTDSFSVIQYISWGKHSNMIVFVSGNDIYWKKKLDSKAIRITSTGKDNLLFNGIPDWVYEEEILERRPSLIVSPDEKHLCYASFNDTNVPLFEIAMYGEEERAYTKIQDIAYPKPGFPNPDVHIYIYNFEKNKEIEVQPPKDLRQGDYYFTNLVWADDQTVSVAWLNRAQNISIVMFCDVDGSCIENNRIIVDNGWISEDYLDPLFSADGSFYIQVLPLKIDKEGDFLHIAVVPSTKNANSKVKFLTSGRWEVKSIVSFDEKNSLIYYQSSEESYSQIHLYSVNMNGKRKCLTCEMNETKDGRCRCYSSSFSTKSSWYILNCHGPSIPMSWLKSTRGQKDTVLEKNKGLQDTVSRTSMPTQKYSMVKTTDGKYGLNLRELRPPGFDENKKYAVIFSVYGGPGSQQVVEYFQTGFHTYLTSNFDVIVCEVDGRGTGSRGRKFEYSVYNELGVFERDDTLAAARYMQSKKYVHPDKFSIWGWSYGGFLSTFILSTQDTKVFQSAIAVAPVTDWRYYDSVYTERYMGQPSNQDNLFGYEYSSVLKHASSIPNDSFLLVHGTGDDNVHFQNSAQLIKVLTEAGVRFDMQIYTDKHHALEGPNIQKHLYHRLTDFFKEKLQL